MPDSLVVLVLVAPALGDLHQCQQLIVQAVIGHGWRLSCRARCDGSQRCWRPSPSAPPRRAAGTTVRNRAPRERRHWCSTSSRTRCTPGSTRRSSRGCSPIAASTSRCASRRPRATPQTARCRPRRLRDHGHQRRRDRSRARGRTSSRCADRAAAAGLGDRGRRRSRSRGPAISRAARSASPGLPSDDAVLDSVLEADEVDPDSVSTAPVRTPLQ